MSSRGDHSRADRGLREETSRAGLEVREVPGGPMEVGVLTIAPAPVTLTQDLPGRISAFRVAEVRARVNGIVLEAALHGRQRCRRGAGAL